MAALRFGRPGEPTLLELLDFPDPEHTLTLHQKRVLAALRAERWSRSAAARALGVTTTSVQTCVQRIARAGVRIERGPGRGRDLRARKGKPVLCDAPVREATCGRGAGHAGPHRSAGSLYRSQSSYYRRRRAA